MCVCRASPRIRNSLFEVGLGLHLRPHGQLLAVHDSWASSSPLASRLSQLGYSGEHFDAKAQQQYLRARFYNPTNGRFNRLDPYAGNMQDPQSLHKYAYVHGDPIRGVDPSGLMSLSAKLSTIAIATSIGSLSYASVFGDPEKSTTENAIEGGVVGFQFSAGLFIAKNKPKAAFVV